MLILSSLVRKAMKREDFISAFVIGPQGIGKTTYAMLVAHEVYGSWSEVLKHLFFDPRDALEVFEGALTSGTRVPLVIFDDAGYHLSKYLLSTPEGYRVGQLYNALINLARTMVAGIIYTSPDMDVLKELRKKAWIVGEVQVVTTYSDPGRIVKLYRKRIGPSGQVYIKKLGIDNYRLGSIPQDVMREYLIKRKKAITPLLHELKQALTNQLV